MTRVYITIDTEYSSGLVNGTGDADRADNFARSIKGETASGAFGIAHKLAMFARYGIRASFFVDPMPALVWGTAAIEDIVGPILDAGQDVQLHCHTEWLSHARPGGPLARVGTGRCLYDFDCDAQTEILEFARDTLVAAGAPRPVAFRAGNYGANDDTLRALARLGLAYDTSHCPALGDGASRISLGPDARDPVHHCGVTEVPVGTIGTHGGGQRHAQITALTLAEMTAAIRHAQANGRTCFTLVTHSFELVNRRSRRENPIVRRRFDGLCRAIRMMPGVRSACYRDHPPAAEARKPAPPLPANPIRTGLRYAEQLVSNGLYGAT
ncbi:polysaccharide deacetylase family protein [Qipengyuania nanhaisediminis]|uniref:polysaccharide deacetylase family protein n=1 Tax=Qipengyuania nanhaisediminis TaxID=604088 RepID=UPI0038B33A1F